MLRIIKPRAGPAPAAKARIRSSMRRIVIEAVAKSRMRPPYNQQEYGGDWFFNPDGDLVVRVVGDDLNRPEAFLLALHELIEARLCMARGVSQEVVDAFDGAYTGEGEPGDDPASPYRREHRQACLIEFLMANFLGLDDYGTVA